MSPRRVLMQSPELILYSQPLTDIETHFKALVTTIVEKKLRQLRNEARNRSEPNALPSEAALISEIVSIHMESILHAAANEIDANDKRALSKFNGIHRCMMKIHKKVLLNPQSDCIFCTTVHAIILRTTDGCIEKYRKEKRQLAETKKIQNQRSNTLWGIKHP